MDFDSSDGIKSAWLKLDHLEEIKAVNKVSIDEEGRRTNIIASKT
jgi:hypothetical protein